MRPDEIHLTDIHRLLFGQAPIAFMIEVGVRSVITYVILLIATRLMGKRVAGQMTVLELTIVVTLGAAIGVPLQAPDRGMLPAVLILAIAILYQRGLNLWSFRNRKAEVRIQGDVSTLVRDGCLDVAEMRRTVISRDRLFVVLRQRGLIHLGQVKRAYLESDGRFSIYVDDDPPPGLCVMPDADICGIEDQLASYGDYACRRCGNRVASESLPVVSCGRCGEQDWAAALRVGSLNGLPSDALPERKA